MEEVNLVSAVSRLFYFVQFDLLLVIELVYI